jgi:uncharacterized protein YdaU (DUF1376 family)
MHYYQFNIGNYRRETTHLSLLEHGIYRSLLDTYYLGEGPLCGDDAKLMRTHNIRTTDEEKAFKNVISDFFILQDGEYWHEDCQDRIAKYQNKSEKARQSARARWDGNANAMRTHSECNANQEPTTNNQTKDTSAAADRCPYDKIIEIYHQELPSLPKAQTMTNKRRSSIRARWTENKKHQSLEFWQWFFSKVRANPWWMGEAGDWKIPNFDWLMNPTNFVKVIEHV